MMRMVWPKMEVLFIMKQLKNKEGIISMVKVNRTSKEVSNKSDVQKDLKIDLNGSSVAANDTLNMKSVDDIVEANFKNNLSKPTSNKAKSFSSTPEEFDQSLKIVKEASEKLNLTPNFEEISNLINIRNYIVVSINNSSVDRKTVTELNGTLLLLDKQIVKMLTDKKFKEFVGYQDVNKAIQEVRNLTNIKSGLVR